MIIVDNNSNCEQTITVKPRFGFFYGYLIFNILTYLFYFIYGSIVKYNKFVIL